MPGYTDYLNDAIAQLRQRSADLKAGGREDEAALCRIESNIDEICLTVFNVCAKLAKGDAFTALYLAKLDRLPVSWAQSREAAVAHGDGCKAVIEELKLSTLARSRAKFLELTEV